MKFKIKSKDGNKNFEKTAESKNEAIIDVFNDFYEIEEVKDNRKTPLEYFWQRHPRYKDMKLGFSNSSFQNYSCFTVCLAYLVDKDPLEVHEILKKNKCYSGDLTISDKSAEALGLDLLKGNNKIPGKMTDINYMPEFMSIKEVILARNQHFVVRLVDEKGNRSIFDPWTGKKLPINHYQFISYRLFKVK